MYIMEIMQLSTNVDKSIIHVYWYFRTGESTYETNGQMCQESLNLALPRS